MKGIFMRIVGILMKGSSVRWKHHRMLRVLLSCQQTAVECHSGLGVCAVSNVVMTVKSVAT